MLNETAEQKEKRIFESYKKDLMINANFGGQDWTRFLVVQYVCSFPKIDPYKMAAALVAEGIRIIFDNSAISKAENEKQERKLRRILAANTRTIKRPPNG